MLTEVQYHDYELSQLVLHKFLTKMLYTSLSQDGKFGILWSDIQALKV